MENSIATSRSPSVKGLFAALLVLGFTAALMGQTAIAQTRAPLREETFGSLLARYQDLTYDEWARDLPDPNYLEKLDFDPTKARFYEAAALGLKLNETEKSLFARNGFVGVDQNQRYSFGSAYFGIYTRDLPVLVTTDSILHAMHRSYDEIFQSMETSVFSPLLVAVFEKAHAALAERPETEHGLDVDLYLTVARNLLAGAGSDQPARGSLGDGWDGSTLHARSAYKQDSAALEVLKQIRALEAAPASIYGGKRDVDWSQFRPRGHYTKTAALMRYFRTMMWLGRADTGFRVLPGNDPATDWKRELRAAVALTLLVRETGGDDHLASMERILAFMVGESDNLSTAGMQTVLTNAKVETMEHALSAGGFEAITAAIRSRGLAAQQIRTELVFSDPETQEIVDLPALFQLFGQRYAVDSFVLSKVVFDSILFQGEKQIRVMPTGLDVMAALGNVEAIRLLEPELRRWNYAANLRAAADGVGRLRDGFWSANLYNLWLGALRTLDDRPTDEHFPQVMRTRAWQRKQLQTQLASWAELRHDTILYVKRSYTSIATCEYPAGYVEPYPEFYAAIKRFGEVAGKLLQEAEFPTGLRSGNWREDHLYNRDRYVEFFARFASTVGKLEALARKELAGEPFTEVDKSFLKRTVDINGGGSGAPRYDGWYPQLFFDGSTSDKADPTVADVHFDPGSNKVLELGVGDVNFVVVAVDNETDRAVYVGPVFSYYEFLRDGERPMTDPEWSARIASGNLPDRPTWTELFQGPAEFREFTP